MSVVTIRVPQGGSLSLLLVGTGWLGRGLSSLPNLIRAVLLVHTSSQLLLVPEKQD